jgi:hypothetical protein
MKLYQSPVVFNETEHTYTLNGQQLHGITGMLSRQLFPDKYKDIPDFVLKRAAERGTRIHQDCEFADISGFAYTTEGQHYLELRKDYTVLSGEYTVSDEEYFASNIDCVWEKDGAITLADIKTTSHLDEDYLSWQLSIYAHLFELQNPTLTVSHLCGIWLRDDIAKLVEIPRKPTEDIVRLLQCERNGEAYLLPVEKEETALITRSAIDILIEAKQLSEYYTTRYKEIEQQLLNAMVANGVKSWDAEVLKATYTPAGQTTTFDSSRFKAEHPDLYKEYQKTSNRKETIKITIR